VKEFLDCAFEFDMSEVASRFVLGNYITQKKMLWKTHSESLNVNNNKWVVFKTKFKKGFYFCYVSRHFNKTKKDTEEITLRTER